jgi:hypothetical protein
VSSAAAEESEKGMENKIRLERKPFLMLWFFAHGFGNASYDFLWKLFSF